MTREEAIHVLLRHMPIGNTLMCDAIDMVITALREQEERRWIPFSDPPKEKGCYFVTVKHWFDGNPVAREAYWNGADWLSCEKKHDITPRVTHWMPLPEPPKED